MVISDHLAAFFTIKNICIVCNFQWLFATLHGTNTDSVFLVETSVQVVLFIA